MLNFYKSIYILNFIILLTSSSPIPLFYDRFSRIYGLTIYATPFPLITLGLNARLGTTVPTTTTTTTTQNSIINGTVPTNIVNVSAPIPPDVVTTVSTLLPINNVRIATTPMVLGPLGSRLNIGQGSVVSVLMIYRM